jgi:hypothetical protein
MVACGSRAAQLQSTGVGVNFTLELCRGVEVDMVVTCHKRQLLAGLQGCVCACTATWLDMVVSLR